MFHIETAGVRLKLKALETGKPQTEDVAIHLPNKDHMVWWVNATPHFNEEGTVIGVSMVAVNISEQVMLIIIILVLLDKSLENTFLNDFFFKLNVIGVVISSFCILNIACGN